MKVRFAISPHSAGPDGLHLVPFIGAVERSGFDGIWLSDLPMGAALDPLLGLALAAGRTSRLRLGANVVPLGRNPFGLAKQLAQLDQVSGGRVLLSFVTGLRGAGERQALALGGAARGDVLEEVLALLRAWWAGETVDHDGDLWSFSSLALPVRPVQDPLEVWLGGRGPQALQRVGRIADGWLGAQLTPAECADARRAIEAAASAAGRQVDPEHYGLSIAYARERPDPKLLAAVAARRADADPLALVPVGRDGLRAFLEGCVQAGLSKFVVRPLAPVGSWEEEAQWLATAILDMQT